MKTSRTKHSPEFKAKVALAAIQERETTAALSKRFKIHANQIYKWKKQFLENASKAFEAESGPSTDSEREAELLQKIGELSVERDFLADGLARYR